MNVRITQSHIHGRITAPPSKSATHRALILASLANGESIIHNPLLSEDTIATIEALSMLGVSIHKDGNAISVIGNPGGLHAPTQMLFVGQSGSTLRMIAALASIVKGTTILSGEERLRERPMKDLLDALKKQGIRAESVKKNNFAPIQITGGGQLKGGEVDISGGSISSQFLSSLLMVSPFAKKDVTIVVNGELKSKPYVEMTIAMMEQFGVTVEHGSLHSLFIKHGQRYKPQVITIEGDYSSSSYLLAASAATKGKLTVTNLNKRSNQADRTIVAILKKMGCVVGQNQTSVTALGVQPLKGVALDMSDRPDLVLTVLILGAIAKGKTVIKNISHLAYKETDRLNNPARELRKMGITVDVSGDTITVTGGTLQGSEIETYNDHRMAMAFAIAGLAAHGETIIKNAKVVEKSYPHFFEDLRRIGGKVESL